MVWTEKPPIQSFQCAVASTTKRQATAVVPKGIPRLRNVVLEGGEDVLIVSGETLKGSPSANLRFDSVPPSRARWSGLHA